MAHYNRNNNNILPMEKIVSILSYFFFSIVGCVWLIIGAVTKQNLKPFLKFHIYQSIFLWILLTIVSQLLIGILNILGYIPYLNAFLGFIVFSLNVSLFKIGNISFSIILIAGVLFFLYLSIGVLRGKFSYVPWVSDIIKYNIGR